jgi:hypothetical protein
LSGSRARCARVLLEVEDHLQVQVDERVAPRANTTGVDNVARRCCRSGS